MTRGQLSLLWHLIWWKLVQVSAAQIAPGVGVERGQHLAADFLALEQHGLVETVHLAPCVGDRLAAFAARLQAEASSASSSWGEKKLRTPASAVARGSITAPASAAAVV
jgi:hypothetical protein